MTDPTAAEYLTTQELAELLRIKERKVYDLAASGQVPCIRVVGKLLFPRDEVKAWIQAGRSGPEVRADLPSIVVGSHDPLLEWALRESASGLAGLFDGSFDGLGRFLAREAMACALHVHEPSGHWNIDTVQAAAGALPVVLVRLVTRRRGLLLARDNPLKISGIADLAPHRVVRRQETAASERHFQRLAKAEGLTPDALSGPQGAARTELDLARAVAEGQADAGFGIEAVAKPFGLDFLPLVEERFDLLVWRQAWFTAPMQALIGLVGRPGFADRAAELGGYDVGEALRVVMNGSAP